MISSRHGGEVIASLLRRHGTQQIFTLCGGHISPILIGAKSKGIKVIDVRHEATAVFAADAVTRLSDMPGVAAITAGPGLTNTITAVKNAQMAQSPVILLGGASATMLKGKGALQDIDQMALLKPHVKWCSAVKRLSKIEPLLEKAFQIAYGGVPGPVFIEFPVDLLYPESVVRKWYGISAEASGSLLEQVYLNWHINRLFQEGGFDPSTVSASSPLSPRQDHVQNSVRMIQAAKRPLLLVSSQAMISAATVPVLRNSLLKMGIPTYLSGTARGLLSLNDKIFFRHKRSEALKEADLVILAGAPFDFRLGYGRKIPRETSVISANLSREDLKLNRKPTLAMLADPSFTLSAMAQIWGRQFDGWKDWCERLQKRELSREAEITEQSGYESNKINPVQLLRAVDSKLGDNSILVADGGDFVSTASYIVTPRGPLAWLDPGPFGTLGVGAGFALGAKLCRPDADVWVLYGDGSVAYSLSEFDTFVRHGLPVIGLVGNDAGWTQITRGQVDIFNDDLATTLTATNYHVVAEGYGGKGLLLKSMDKFDDIVSESLAVSRSGMPVLINAILGKTDFRKGSISI
ncbi:MAG: acetolactate synthase [Candidatus Marinimicrobia bacterium]|nr:acetolactate synthase [Candidatus Neomarinimicrobiota bacterium]